MWVFDIDSGEVVDMTPLTAEILDSQDPDTLPRTVSRESHLEACRSVVATGEPHTFIEWVKVNGIWHKMARTKSHAGGSRVLEMALDVTHLDPRAKWLARINLVDQRLELENGKSISFQEFVVLHLLIKGFKHKRIAETLNISRKTVDYRLSRLKDALEVETTEELMMTVFSSGMVHLATVPIDLDDPAQTELELYKKIPD